MERRGRKKKNSQLLSGMTMLAGLIGLLVQIPLAGLIGDDGNAYFAAAKETALFWTAFASCGLPAAVERMTAARAARGQFKNAGRVLHAAETLSFFWCALGSAALFFGADLLAGLLREPLARYPLQAAALLPVLLCAGRVLGAYLSGLGTRMPAALTTLAGRCVFLASAPILAGLLAAHGEDIGALLHNAHFMAAYGSRGAVFGMGCGGAAFFLLTVLIWGMFRSMLGKQKQSDGLRSREPAGQLCSRLIGAAFLTSLPLLLYHLGFVAEQGLFCRYMGESGMADQQAAVWGVYTGKYRVLMLLAAVPAVSAGGGLFPVLSAAVRSDTRLARDRMQTAMRLTAFLTLPFVFLLALLARPLTEYLYTGEVALAAALLRVGSLQTLLLPAAWVSGIALERMGRGGRAALHTLAAFVVQIGSFLLFLRVLDLGVYAAVYAQMAAAFVLLFLHLLAVCRLLRYRQEWIRTFAVPAGLSALTGGAGWLLFWGLSRLLGNLAVFPALAAAAALYFAAAVRLRVVSERDLSRLPLGSLLTGAARALRLF